MAQGSAVPNRRAPVEVRPSDQRGTGSKPEKWRTYMENLPNPYPTKPFLGTLDVDASVTTSFCFEGWSAWEGVHNADCDRMGGTGAKQGRSMTLLRTNTWLGRWHPMFRKEGSLPSERFIHFPLPCECVGVYQRHQSALCLLYVMFMKLCRQTWPGCQQLHIRPSPQPPLPLKVSGQGPTPSHVGHLFSASLSQTPFDSVSGAGKRSLTMREGETR